MRLIEEGDASGLSRLPPDYAFQASEALLLDHAPPDRLRLSLAVLSGQLASAPPYETDLVRDVEQAWRTPDEQLTLGQVRLLVSQGFGLKWLARPVLDVIEAMPALEVALYPGDLTKAALDAAELFLFFERPHARTWLEGDWSWRGKVYGWSRPLLREVDAALAIARKVASIERVD